jgi:VWFA-related protein
VYDAVYLASKEKLAGEVGRKAIILISDGEDTTSRLKFNEALRSAHQSDTIIYAISNSVGSAFPYFRRGRSGFGGDIGTLRKFSSETGGATFVVNSEDTFQRIFSQIAQELRSQYSLGYLSTNTARDGKFREIKIVPRNSSYSVRARKGYYAPKGTNSR